MSFIYYGYASAIYKHVCRPQSHSFSLSSSTDHVRIFRKEHFSRSNPKQVVIIVLIVTLIWGYIRRWTSNPSQTALSSSDQVLWHCLILWQFFVLKVSPTLVLVALFKFMSLLMAPFCSQGLDGTCQLAMELDGMSVE